MPLFYNHFYIGDNRITENDFFREDPLLLTLTETQPGPRDQVYSHKHPHMEIFYFKSGHGVFECDGRSIATKPHDIIVVNANCEHFQHSDDGDEPLVYYNFLVDRLHIENALHNGISENPFEYHAFNTDENDIYSLIQKILAELQNKQCDYYSKVQALFTILLIDLIRLFQTPRSTVEGAYKTNTKKLLLQTKEYIDMHFAEALSLEQLTRISLMQKSYFMHQFKAHFGVSPIKYLNQVRIENAKIQLITTFKPITEIAADVGFNTPAYFSEMFLRESGMTPSEYRNSRSLL